MREVKKSRMSGKKARKVLLRVLLVSIITGLSVPSVFGEDESGPWTGGGGESAGGKRTKAEIDHLITQMLAEKQAGKPEGRAAKWLNPEPEVKYPVEKRLAAAIHLLKQRTRDADAKISGAGLQHDAYTSLVAELLSLGNVIRAADQALQLSFMETEQKCLEDGLPEVILQRHRRMVENHNENIQRLLDRFDEIEHLTEEKAWEDILPVIQGIGDQLEEYEPIREPPLLSNGLPHGLRYIEAPTVLREDTDIPSIRPISEKHKGAGPPASLEGAGISSPVQEEDGPVAPQFVSGPPAPEDLAPTIDVQITQEIIDLAAGLGNSPLEIYEYLRNNFDFEPYLGSRKGSEETLNQGAGNDYDLSSLLIALLRAANIPARYVRGTVELPVERAMNWLGVEDGATAGSILTTVGMEGVSIIDGGGQVVSIRFKHVWVEAYIPYTNYRGIPADDTGKMWVPMDPSFKAFTYQPGIDIPAEMGFDAEAFIDDYISTFHELSPVELYMQQISDYLAVNYPELDYEDIVRTRIITPQASDFLPGSLPLKVRSVDSDFAEIPPDSRYTIRFHLYDGGTTFIDYTANLPEIAGKRVTISYVAATQADQDVIDAYGDLYDTPPYLLNLRPVLKVDGTDVAVSAASIGMGLTHSSDMHFTTPVGETNEMPLVINSIIAGTYQAVGIDTGTIPPDIFMPEPDEGTPVTDDLTGGKLWKTAMGYLDRIETYDNEVAKTMQMVVTKDVSEAIVENTILVTFSLGTPLTFEWVGLVVDADRNIVGPFAVNGDNSKSKPFMVLTGAEGSISENRIFEDMYDEEAVSTIKILELASDMGIPIYVFDSGNIATIYSTLNLSASVENVIYSAVLNGHEVTVPRDNITYLEWYGTGYIDMDPTTGAAGYIISGGHSGGATVDWWIAWKVWTFTIFRNLCDANPITADITFPPAGSYFPSLSWTDFLFSNQLHFDVTYNICYEGGGTKTVYEVFRPHKPYPPGNYTFHAGSGTGKTLDHTIFGVEIQTPDGEDAISGCDTITLEANVIPSPPPSPSYQWSKGWCILGCGDGTFTPDNAANTEFGGTQGGGVTAKVEVSNTYGGTKAESKLSVSEVSMKSVDFTGTGNHTIKKQGSDSWTNDTFAHDGDTTIDYPEWQDNNSDGAAEKDEPVCFTMGSSPGMAAVLAISPALSTAQAVRLQVSKAGSELLTRDISLVGSETVVSSLDWSSNLAPNVDNMTSSLTWRISQDMGTTYHDIGTSTTKFFVVFSPPTGTSPTARRIDWCSAKANSADKEEEIADSIHDGVAAETSFGGSTNGWSLLDGGAGDCDNQARLMSYGVKMLGVSPATVQLVRASTDAANCLDLESRTVGAQTHYLIMDFDIGAGYNWNAFEGCCETAGNFYAVTPKKKADSAYNMLKAISCQQYWVRTNVPPGTAGWNVLEVLEEVPKP